MQGEFQQGRLCQMRFGKKQGFSLLTDSLKPDKSLISICEQQIWNIIYELLKLAMIWVSQNIDGEGK